MDNSYEVEVKAKIWIFDGPSPWYFVTIPEKLSADIRHRYRNQHRGWGSIPVKVNLGKSEWKTSIFWEKKGTYIMAIKKEIRNTEKVTSGDMVDFILKFENVI